MKKYIDIAFYYALAAMAGGVFYREFTKFNGFTGRTSLGLVHTHLFLLGCVVFLLTALLCDRIPADKEKHFKKFMVLYNVGVPMTALLLATRGITQVLALPLSAAASAAISGLAGLAHILTGVGLVFWFLCLKKASR